MALFEIIVPMISKCCKFLKQNKHIVTGDFYKSDTYIRTIKVPIATIIWDEQTYRNKLEKVHLFELNLRI